MEQLKRQGGVWPASTPSAAFPRWELWEMGERTNPFFHVPSMFLRAPLRPVRPTMSHPHSPTPTTPIPAISSHFCLTHLPCAVPGVSVWRVWVPCASVCVLSLSNEPERCVCALVRACCTCLCPLGGGPCCYPSISSKIQSNRGSPAFYFRPNCAFGISPSSQGPAISNSPHGFERAERTLVLPWPFLSKHELLLCNPSTPLTSTRGHDCTVGRI